MKVLPKGTRRGHGEGTKYQREDGYWIGQITLGKNDEGKQDRKTFSAKTEKDLNAKMKEFQYKQMRGELPKTDTICLSSWMESWLENYKRPKLRQTTYENYETIFKTHIQGTLFGRTQVQKLTTDQIQRFMKVKAEKGKLINIKEEVEEQGEKKTITKQVESPLSHRTVNLIHFLIQQALEQAKKNNLVSNNAANNCELYRSEKKEVKPLSREDVIKLLRTVKGHRLYTALILELNTGIRRGELLALRWDNVDLNEGAITIIENLVRIKGGSKIHKPKTKSSNRTIYLPEKVKTALEEHKALQEQEKTDLEDKRKKLQDEGKEAEGYKDEGLVFCQLNGKPINPRNFQRTFNTWVSNAGLPEDIRFHDLRHTFITNMIGQGIDIKTAQSITGHSDTRTLLETYSHFINESQKKAARTMNDLIPEI